MSVHLTCLKRGPGAFAVDYIWSMAQGAISRPTRKSVSLYGLEDRSAKPATPHIETPHIEEVYAHHQKPLCSGRSMEKLQDA